jgi:small subunit ribosomal protein S2
MAKISTKDLLQAGVHFGHLKKKWNPKMSEYIFVERKGIHIIDLNKTLKELETTAAAMKQIAYSGKKIMFVATKKQAKEIVKDAAKSVNMPYITERWYGGMLTNFSTIRKSIKKMDTYDKMVKDGTINNLNKRERLMMARENEKLDRTLGGIAQLNRLPAAVFVVDINKEHIAIAEATKLNVKTFALVDTNCDPTKVDFAVPGNDDAAKSVQVITDYLVSAIKEGLEERRTTRKMKSLLKLLKLMQLQKQMLSLKRLKLLKLKRRQLKNQLPKKLLLKRK